MAVTKPQPAPAVKPRIQRSTSQPSDNPVSQRIENRPSTIDHRPSLLAEYPPITGMQPAHFTKLQTLCGPRWIDLLFHLPRTVLDRSAAPTIANAVVGERATILARVTKRPPVRAGFNKRTGKKIPLTVELSDESGHTLRAIYFNPQSWLERAFPYGVDPNNPTQSIGGMVILSGKIEADNKGKKIIHPDVWSAGKGLADIAKVWPLYPLTAGLAQGWVTRAIQQALTHLNQNRPAEWLPASLIEEHQLPSFPEALQSAHNPTSVKDIEPNTPAHMRLALDEFLATQLALQHARSTTRFQPGLSHGNSELLTHRLLKSLPFPLTTDQTNALEEINSDLSTPRPMLRLLQGDVGSGKTLVALLALLRVIENGHQGVLMAPTEILAHQLYNNARKYLEPLGVTIGLLVGSHSAAQKKRLKQHVKEGFVNLLVGTHALTQDDVVFDKLGLAVIDEQHRFGVKQRMSLSVNQTLPPDLLLMTATPIPRTLALTVYGDMDVSTLRNKPPGRTPIQTVAMPDDRLPEIAAKLKNVLAAGEQVYWICPLVDESEDTDLAAATARCAYLQKVYKNDVAVLHGKMKAAEKDETMRRFQQGEIKILVSTTVVEVGVDVPNASLMVIEHAERFGLSQLHQLRGRVGRGAAASRCILLYAPPITPYATERINALRQSDDGFILAEKDLELRGPGEVLGTRQSGQISTLLADLHHHRNLIPIARDLAQQLLSSNLTTQQRNALALLLQLFNQNTAATFLRAG